MQELAGQVGITRQTLNRWLKPCWESVPVAAPHARPRVLVLDATTVVPRTCVVLIGQDPGTSRPVSWFFADREKYATWHAFLSELTRIGTQPQFVVCDGQRGMRAVLRLIWPATQVQRCVIHIHRQARLWLTQHPKTAAGRSLLLIVDGLLAVRTRRQKRRWIRRFHQWLHRYEAFLKERTRHPMAPRRWWYTHRKLRAVRSLLKNSLPDLFRYIGHPEVPRTSNHVEGGVNSRLKELLRSHRGLSAKKRRTLTAYYLAKLQERKPTRNVT